MFPPQLASLMPLVRGLFAPQESLLPLVTGAPQRERGLLTQAELDAAYARVRDAYKAAGAEQNLVLQAAP